MRMKTTVLVDNNAGEGLGCEWGFAALIETPSARILLDTGASPLFADNAEALGIDLATVDVGVLSHAHYDHSDGLDAFFAANGHAPFYVAAAAAENCYSDAKGDMHYIGVRKGVLADHGARFLRAGADGAVCAIAPDAWLVPHSTPGIAEQPTAARMFVEDEGGVLQPDDFAHEQTLVVETEAGLVVFNSCSHAGPSIIINEVRAAFPACDICAFVGGLHLFKLSDDEVRGIAAQFRALGIERVYTGHCTGDHAIELLREELGEGVVAFYSGLVFEI